MELINKLKLPFLALSFLASALGPATAQVDGPVKDLVIREKFHNVRNPYAMIRPAPLCNGDLVYGVEGIDRGDHFYGYVHSINAGGVIASRELEFDREVKESFKFLSFFMAGENPAILFRQWEKKTGKVSLLVNRYDPMSFQPVGSPQEIGMIPFDPKSFYGYGPDMEVRNSPDGSKVLIYFDKLKSQGVQLVMCWVLDSSLKPLWNAIYKVPAQSVGFERELLFSNEGAIYLEVDAVLLSEDNTKEKADGSIKVKVKQNYWKDKTKSYFKLFNEEYRMWDGSLSDEHDVHGGALALRGNEVYFGALIRAKGKDDGPMEWVIAQMSNEFIPQNGERILVENADQEDLGLTGLVMEDQGGGYFIGRNEEHTVVSAFDENLEQRWTSSLKWEFWHEPHVTPIARNEQLYLYTLGGSQAGKEKSGELNQKGGLDQMPVVAIFDEQGNVMTQTVLSKEDGGERLIDYPRLSFSSIARCGYFLDHTYAKGKSGFVYVPMR